MFPTTASRFLKTFNFGIILESQGVAETAEKLHIFFIQFLPVITLHIFVGQCQKQKIDVGTMYVYHSMTVYHR